MTSKEALNKLCMMANTPELAIWIEFCYDIVEKDLKVLEILKKYLFIVEPDNEEDFKEFNRVDYLRLMDFMTREEYQVIKEWLENE